MEVFSGEFDDARQEDDNLITTVGASLEGLVVISHFFLFGVTKLDTTAEFAATPLPVSVLLQTFLRDLEDTVLFRAQMNFFGVINEDLLELGERDNKSSREILRFLLFLLLLKE